MGPGPEPASPGPGLAGSQGPGLAEQSGWGREACSPGPQAPSNRLGAPGLSMVSRGQGRRGAGWPEHRRRCCVGSVTPKCVTHTCAHHARCTQIPGWEVCAGAGRRARVHSPWGTLCRVSLAPWETQLLRRPEVACVGVEGRTEGAPGPGLLLGHQRTLGREGRGRSPAWGVRPHRGSVYPPELELTALSLRHSPHPLTPPPRETRRQEESRAPGPHPGQAGYPARASEGPALLPDGSAHL